MKSQGKKGDPILKIMNILMLVLFLPVLFCVVFIGNGMDYFEGAKADILVPNIFLALIALAAGGVCVWLISRCGRITSGSRASRYLDLGLVLLFFLFFLFCMVISHETVFDMAVDPGIVRAAARDVAHGIPFGYRFEFSMNHNNLPITYLLGRLYRFAEGRSWFAHQPEYLWLTVGCMVVSGAGFCCCEIVKKLTGNLAAVLVAFALYLATAGLSPWKYIPYTDSYVILFPVLCVWLYLCSRDCRKRAGRFVFLFFALFFGVTGGFIKPSAYIAVLAVLCLEGIRFFTALIRWRLERSDPAAAGAKTGEALSGVRDAGIFLLYSLAVSGILVLGTGLCKERIVKSMGLEYNEEIEATAQYFFFMGTNELTTGSFTIEDYGVFGEFQFSKAERNAACLERAWERIKARGPFGTAYFALKKLVRSFNDGTFAWTGVQYYEPFPEDLTHDNRAADYLRSLFMPGGANQDKYDTFAELVWILALLGVPGIVLASERKEDHGLFAILVTGVLCYLMLFESGARYVFIFLPIFICMSACGMYWIGNLPTIRRITAAGRAVKKDKIRREEEEKGR